MALLERRQGALHGCGCTHWQGALPSSNLCRRLHSYCYSTANKAIVLVEFASFRDASVRLAVCAVPGNSDREGVFANHPNHTTILRVEAVCICVCAWLITPLRNPNPSTGQTHATHARSSA